MYDYFIWNQMVLPVFMFVDKLRFHVPTKIFISFDDPNNWLISISEFLDDGTLLSVSGFPFGKSMKSSRSADSILPTDADRGLE